MFAAFKPTIGFLLLVSFIGIGHGLWTDRWVYSQELQNSLIRLDRVPMNVGDWRGENLAYEPEDMARAGIRGTVLRRYRNSRTGAAVTLLVVCGRGGPISVHTPDVCYEAAGYQQSGKKENVNYGDPAGNFDKSFFVLPNALVNRRLEIAWAWSRDGLNWSAPESPRYAFARFPAVYKLYVVRELPAESKVADVTSKEFLEKLLPELRTVFGNRD